MNHTDESLSSQSHRISISYIMLLHNTKEKRSVSFINVFVHTIALFNFLKLIVQPLCLQILSRHHITFRYIFKAGLLHIVEWRFKETYTAVQYIETKNILFFIFSTSRSFIERIHGQYHSLPSYIFRRSYHSKAKLLKIVINSYKYFST